MNYRPRLPHLLAMFALSLVFAAQLTPAAANCCPFCASQSLTLTEQLSVADAAVLVEWVSGKKGDAETAGNTTYEIKQIVKGKELKKGGRVTLERFRSAKPGDLFMLLGTKAETIEWGSPLEVTETSYNYIAQAPTPESPANKRLGYFLKFLEYSDPVIANDAFAEFANSQYKDVTALSKELPREKLRKWVVSEDVPATRLGLYAMMLGLCGDESDAKVLEGVILDSSDDFRLGIDGVMGGYLLLRGEDGLAVIEKSKLTDKKAVFSETFAAMQALRFMWTYGEGKISQQRLRESMRILLDRPELADLVIADLARWKDWGVQQDLMKLYGAEEYNIPSIKRAIIRYMLVASRDVPKEAGDTPSTVIEARRYLDKLRKSDPKTVSEAERFFVAP